jgi:hypothetical protein
LQGIMAGSRRMFEEMTSAIEANGVKPVIEKRLRSRRCRKPCATWRAERTSAKS